MKRHIKDARIPQYLQISWYNPPINELKDKNHSYLIVWKPYIKFNTIYDKKT